MFFLFFLVGFCGWTAGTSPNTMSGSGGLEATSSGACCSGPELKMGVGVLSSATVLC
jgi:hypothetical protein